QDNILAPVAILKEPLEVYWNDFWFSGISTDDPNVVQHRIVIEPHLGEELAHRRLSVQLRHLRPARRQESAGRRCPDPPSQQKDFLLAKQKPFLLDRDLNAGIADDRRRLLGDPSFGLGDRQILHIDVERAHIDPAIIPNRYERALLSRAPPHHHFQAVPGFYFGQSLVRGLFNVQIVRLDRTGKGGIAGRVVRDRRAG